MTHLDEYQGLLVKIRKKMQETMEGAREVRNSALIEHIQRQPTSMNYFLFDWCHLIRAHHAIAVDLIHVTDQMRQLKRELEIGVQKHAGVHPFAPGVQHGVDIITHGQYGKRRNTIVHRLRACEQARKARETSLLFHALPYQCLEGASFAFLDYQDYTLADPLDKPLP